MELLDIYTITIIVSIALVVVGIAAVTLYNQNVKLEELLDYESKQCSYYSKESLDRMEQVFQLRRELLDANLQIKKLSKKG
jgi:hypothetical protein